MVLFEVIKEIVTYGFYGILLWLVMAVCYYSVKELFKQESAKMSWETVKYNGIERGQRE